MSPDRLDELINQPQPSSYNNNERPKQYEGPQGLSMGDLEPNQGDPGEQKCSCKKEGEGAAHQLQLTHQVREVAVSLGITCRRSSGLTEISPVNGRL
jgi:hypothetical protein